MPQELLADCTRPGLAGLRTNGDMATRLVDYDKAIELCNSDKAALRGIQSGAIKAGAESKF